MGKKSISMLLLMGAVIFTFLLFTESLGIALFYGFLFSASMIGFIASVRKMNSNKQRTQQNILLSLRPTEANFQDSLSYVSPDLLSRITTDNENEYFYIWTPLEKDVITVNDVRPGMPYDLATFQHSDILAIEYAENGIILNQLTKQSTSAENWLEKLPSFKHMPSKKKESGDRIHTISLRIFVKDKAMPVYTIQFYNHPGSGLRQEDAEYKKIQLELQQWLTIFQDIINKTDRKVANVIENDTRDVSDRAPVEHTLQSSQSEKEIVSMKLIAALKQVIQQKQAAPFTDTAIKNNQQQQTASYFDEILRKNREMMHGDKDA